MFRFNKKVIEYVAVTAIVLGIAGGSFWGGFHYGRQFPQNLVIKGVANLEDSAGQSNIDFGEFWQAWQLIDDKHLKAGDVGSQQRVYGAIRGLVGSLNDPYSDFFNPEEGKKFQEDIRGNFGGIGAELGTRDGFLTIVAPLKDTPASKAGLDAGDKILKIDETITDGLTVDRAVSLIRGPIGTTVKLLVVRDGWDAPKDFTLTRAEIMIPTLESVMKPGGILEVTLHSFNENSEPLFYQAVRDGLSQGMRGLVLDLRGNPGGYLSTAVNLAGWFLPKGSVVVSEANREGIQQTFTANGNAALQDIPVVVLINGGSASASEILAGALHDVRHVQLIGTKSFGKGTVQELETLKDGSSLKLTIAHWVLPSGKILESEGLDPDVLVEISQEDSKKGSDPQLARALEILGQTIAAGSTTIQTP